MSKAAPSRTFPLTLLEGSLQVVLPFDPRTVFGRARPPVVVTIGDYTYRSTVCTMRGVTFVPLRRSHREGAGVVEGTPVDVTLTLDTEPRSIAAPDDLRAALEEAGAWDRWQKLAYTHQREHVEAVEGAKKPETRARRIAKCVATLSA